jgi:hypothetical protein
MPNEYTPASRNVKIGDRIFVLYSIPKNVRDVEFRYSSVLENGKNFSNIYYANTKNQETAVVGFTPLMEGKFDILALTANKNGSETLYSPIRINVIPK